MYREPLQVYREPLQAYRRPLHAYREPLHAYREPLHAYREPLQVYREPLQAYRETLHAYRETLHPHHGPSHSHRGPSHSHRGPSRAYRGPSRAYRGLSHAYRGPPHAYREPSHAPREPSHACRGPSHAPREPSHAPREPSHACRGPSHACRGPSHAPRTHLASPPRKLRDVVAVNIGARRRTSAGGAAPAKGTVMSEPRRSSERAALLAAVERVRPTALAHTEASERGRTLARPVVDALRESGLFGMAVPRALGGAECDPLTQLEIFEAMSRVDASAGWSLMIGALTTALAGAYLPARGRAQIFAGASPICVGLQQPAGVARRAPGGYLLTGRWAFGSGIRHADWVLSGALIEPGPDAAPAGLPAMLTAVVPVAQVHIEDTWDASGLRGSGSEHYRMESVFVPDDLVYAFPTAPRRCGGPLFGLPLLAVLTPAHVGFALGVARRALDEIIDLAPRRQKIWTRLPLGGHAAFHMDLGRAEARLGAARAYAFEVIGMMWDRALAAQPLSFDDWAAIRLVTTYVTETAAEVVTFAYRAGGGTALYASSPLQRCFRDIHAATQHIAATDDAYEFAGRVRLGLAEPHPLLAARDPG